MPAALPPDTRDRLLDAADQLLAESGYARMTVDTLAAMVGIGKGSVYLHFPSKQEVALACIERNAERVLAELERLAASTGSADLRLRAMLRARVSIRFDYARRHQDSLEDLFAAFRGELLTRREQQFAREAAVITRVLNEGVRAKLFSARRAEGAATALILATNAFLPLSLSTAELGRRADVLARADSVITLITAGLTSARLSLRRATA